MKPLAFCLALSMLLSLSLFFSRTVHAQTAPAGGQDAVPFNPLAALPAAEWRQVESSVDRALVWLASQQRSDGSFQSVDAGQPGVTSLCVMAFFARGYTAEKGPYGAALGKAIQYTIACQKKNGLLCRLDPYAGETGGPGDPLYTGAYNHAISGVMLAEAYGMAGPALDQSIGLALRKALEFTYAHQHAPKSNPNDRGGWRYLKQVDTADSDLSVTSWNLMFLRAAKNAGYAVPQANIDEAVGYVGRVFDPRRKSFVYRLGSYKATRAMAGAGILALSLSGLHNTTQARGAADWVLANPFAQYNASIMENDRYHYGAYHCSLGMFQMGGDYWKQFYPILARALLSNQTAEGNWHSEAGPAGEDAVYGNAYTTALASMALSVPFQLVPIYQR